MNREELIAKARDIVNQDVVKGFTADFLKMAANDTVNPNRFETYLKNISEQAWDPGTEENTIFTYSQELVDIVKELFPKNPDYPYLQESRLNTVKIVQEKSKKKIEKGPNEIKTFIKSLLRESIAPQEPLTPKEAAIKVLKATKAREFPTKPLHKLMVKMIDHIEGLDDVKLIEEYLLEKLRDKKISHAVRVYIINKARMALINANTPPPPINEAREHTNDEIVDFNEIDLQHEYNKLNQLLFNGNLQPVTMLWNKRKGAHGVVKGKRNRSTGKITLTSLSMSQFLKVPYKFFKDVLAHEMIHVFWMQQDVNAKHGPLFKQEMNRINSMGLGFNVSVRSDSSETSKFEVSQDAVRPGMQLVCLLMDTDKSKNMLSVMKYDAYKKEAHNIIKIYDYLINEQPKYKFAEGEFLLSTNPRLQAKTIQRNFRSVSYTIVDDTLANEIKENAKFLSKFVINNDGPHVEGPDQPNPAPPKSLLGF
jgi:predicted SprT family Zn-dependent metalloprotease